MNVIFLDVDGVIDSKRKRNHLDSAKLQLLVEAAQRTLSRIVISSHWRLVQTQHRQLRAVLHYLGLEVVGSTPVRRPWEPERPIEIYEWLTAYNAHAHELQRPAVTNFVAIDDRDLLSERGGAQLRGHFVRTDVNIGMTATSVERVVELLGAADAREDVAPVPSLAEALMAAGTVKEIDVPRGTFGEIRLDLVSSHSTECRQYTCTLIANSGACGDGSGPRPSPWIVTGDRESDVGGSTGSSRVRLPSAAELTVRVGARLARVSASLGGHSVRGGSVFFGGGGTPRTPTKDKSAPRGEAPTPPRAPHTVHGGDIFCGR